MSDPNDAKKMLEDACRRQDFAAMARFCTNVMDDGKYIFQLQENVLLNIFKIEIFFILKWHRAPLPHHATGG